MGNYYANLGDYPLDTSCDDHNIYTLVGCIFFFWTFNEILKRSCGLDSTIHRTESLQRKDVRIIKNYVKKKLRISKTIRGSTFRQQLKDVRSQDDLDKVLQEQKQKKGKKKIVNKMNNEIELQKINEEPNQNENDIDSDNENKSKLVTINENLNKSNSEIIDDEEIDAGASINLTNNEKRSSRNLYRDGSKWNDKSIHSLKREMLEQIIDLQTQELQKHDPNYNVMDTLKYDPNNVKTPTQSTTIAANFDKSNSVTFQV